MRLFSKILKLSLIKNTTIKKLKLILNIAIFLSLFAIISTIISISFEYKINLNQKKISQNNLLIDIASLSIDVLPRNINSLTTTMHDSKKNLDMMFFLYFSKSGDIFDERDLYFLGTSRLANLLDDNYEKIQMFSDITSYEDFIIINDDYKSYLKLKEEIKFDEIKFNELYNKLIKDAEKNTIIQNGIKVIENKEFYKSLEKYYFEFLNLAQNQIDIQIKILIVIRSITDKKKNENIEIRKVIAEYSSSISKYILFAFLFQLIIFVIVQIFEVYSTKKEIDA